MPRTYRIHPAIGIARVGDSPDDYFIGPEAPGVPPSLNKPDALPSPHATYKDPQGRIKRQGARFRVYEYTHDNANVLEHVREITSAEAQIDWQVHLANRKAAAPRFDQDGRRNAGIPESRLVIDAGAQKLSGAGQGMKRLKGSFQGSSQHAIEVPLGDLLTDSAGRLIILGGLGTSQSVARTAELQKIRHFANNDDWCDDVSDGPVRATIRLHGTTEPVEADSAWVIVAPPDFAPPIENVVTLYDVIYNMMARFDPSLAVSEATKVSFTRDIYPIFRRVSNMHWVSDVAAGAHAPNMAGYFMSQLPILSSPTPEASNRRGRIFRRLRNPSGGGGDMPKLPASTEDENLLALTEVQYKKMEKWARGDFEPDWSGQEPVPLALDKLAVEDRPHALDRAALEACVGGGFFPGIEVGQMMLQESTYDKRRPFRINAQLLPGSLTANMAVPWQADFRDCEFEDGLDWWPGQRPNQVWRGTTRDRWVPRAWTSERMVQEWSKLGFVVRETGTDRLVEHERSL
jgi:L-Lysine epsilon oxidase N-terminal/L-lysine epsilon oxidase C-terminal domain